MKPAHRPNSWLHRLESLHPYEMLLYLGMVSSGLLFLFLAVAFLSTGSEQLDGIGRHIPTSFLFSTLVLMSSGYTAGKLRLYFEQEKIRQVASSLSGTLVLGLAFAGLQWWGWKELQAMGLGFEGIPRGSFLYVLTGIHLVHLFGAMIFGGILWVQLRRQQEDAVQQLILLTNPFEKMRIRLFARYWLFMDAVWLLLFVLLVLSF